MYPVQILGSGMVTGIGLDWASTCAAMRCGMNRFGETRFIDAGGKWIIGSEALLARPYRGRKKLEQLVVPAIKECLLPIKNISADRIQLILCVAEPHRPGRLPGIEDLLMTEVQVEVGARFHPASKTIAQGRVSGVMAVQEASNLLREGRVRYCVIAGTDSFLLSRTLAAYESGNRLLTSKNSNGFIPGEAGAAVLMGNFKQEKAEAVRCLGVGFARETAIVESELPLRADGMVEAFKASLADASKTMGDIDYRFADVNGEQYGFKEATLSVMRTLRQRKDRFEILHLADSIGEVGAASVPCVLGAVLAANQKGYALGRTAICHFSNDDGERAAMVVAH